MRRGIAILMLVVLAALPAAAEAAAPTGRHLVVFERQAAARASLLSAVLARTGVERAGRGVPALGIATVEGPAAALARLRRDPAVASVSAEWRRDLRRVPNDPALSRQQPEALAGTVVQWWLARSGFPEAWDVTTGASAVVGIIDSGIDGSHPQLAPKIASGDAFGSLSGPLVDEDGHGSHVSGLACASTDDGAGIAGAGWGCRIALVKAPLLRDEDIAAGIQRAVERGANAINMSFGGGPESAALNTAIDYAVQSGVVLVAAASNGPDSDQGAPASQLQPGDAADIGAGRGLVVTAVDFSSSPAGTGRGAQISLAAYGFWDGTPPFTGPLGLLSSYPSTTQTEVPPLIVCGCRESFDGDSRYAYLEGTSMATPQVTATAALVGDLNPFLSAAEKIRLIKESARRSDGWSPELGWGILDAGRAIDAARRIDHVAPASRARGRRRVRRPRRVMVALAGSDPAGHPGLLPTGVRSFELYMKRGKRRFRRIRAGEAGPKLALRLRPGVYRFYTRATDAAGNQEAAPPRADLRVRVSRRR